MSHIFLFFLVFLDNLLTHNVLPLLSILMQKNRGCADLLKMVDVEILLNFGNCFCTLQLGFWKFLSGIMFLHY